MRSEYDVMVSDWARTGSTPSLMDVSSSGRHSVSVTDRHVNGRHKLQSSKSLSIDDEFVRFLQCYLCSRVLSVYNKPLFVSGACVV